MDSLKIEGLSSVLGEQQGIGSASSLKDMQESAAGGKEFSGLFNQMIEKVNEQQVQSDTAIKEVVSGKTKNLHEAMLAIERADTSLKLMMQVRNKVLDAYREVMRMQV